MPKRKDKRRKLADQDAAAADQTAADMDQSASDTDQSVSDRDQAQADADQRASERDQAAADRDLASHPTHDPELERMHALSRADRARGTLDRHTATVVRAQVSFERDDQATKRDDAARIRDEVAEQRDRIAEEDDDQITRIGDLNGDDPRVTEAVIALAEMRERAAAHRAQAAADRWRAAADREAAAKDREHLLLELERAHLDDLTGAYRRGMGEIALVNEIVRAQRNEGGLALAYIDCDGLKLVNDRDGHAAGDALLRDLVSLLLSNLRPYDPVVRWGGDEFVCAMSGADLEHARKRFEGIRVAFAQTTGSSMTVGFATLQEGDTLESLVERADTALLEARRKRQATH